MIDLSNPQLALWAAAGILNARWTMKDMMDIEAMAKDGWGASDIAEAFFTTSDDIEALCARNGLILRGSSKGMT